MDLMDKGAFEALLGNILTMAGKARADRGVYELIQSAFSEGRHTATEDERATGQDAKDIAARGIQAVKDGNFREAGWCEGRLSKGVDEAWRAYNRATYGTSERDVATAARYAIYAAQESVYREVTRLDPSRRTVLFEVPGGEYRIANTPEALEKFHKMMKKNRVLFCGLAKDQKKLAKAK